MPSWCRERAEALRAALEAHAWDGAWYRRAYFDDGTPLGSAPERRMPDRLDPADLGGALRRRGPGAAPIGDGRGRRAPGPPRRRADPAVRPAVRQGALQPGYIKGYVPGVRENGGQYTHAAIWVVLAFALQGDGDRAWELFEPDQPDPPRRDARGGRSATRSSRTSSRPTSTAPRRTPAAAAGPGTPARRAGSTASPSRRSSASTWKATPFASSRASRAAGRDSRSTTAIGPRPTGSGWTTRPAPAAASGRSSSTAGNCPRARCRWATIGKHHEVRVDLG